MIRIAAVAIFLGILGAGAAISQTVPAPPSVASAPAPATGPPLPITGPAAMARTRTAAASTAGASSFTEAEARSRLAAQGYTDVTALQKDAQLIWRGSAMKNGRAVGVALDAQGNVVAQ
jgi:protein CpxP